MNQNFNRAGAITYSFLIPFYRFPYSEFLQRYGILLRQESGQISPDPFLSDHSDAKENKENEMLIDPLDVLYQKQLSMRTTPKKNATPKKRLRRRAGNT
jgi:hypothetical protein